MRVRSKTETVTAELPVDVDCAATTGRASVRAAKGRAVALQQIRRARPTLVSRVCISSLDLQKSCVAISCGDARPSCIQVLVRWHWACLRSAFAKASLTLESQRQDRHGRFDGGRSPPEGGGTAWKRWCTNFSQRAGHTMISVVLPAVNCGA